MWAIHRFYTRIIRIQVLIVDMFLSSGTRMLRVRYAYSRQEMQGEESKHRQVGSLHQ